jgi:hypothetical protein
MAVTRKLKMKPSNNKYEMSLTDLKIYGLNITTFGISFTDIDLILKIVLVLVSIGYTIHKWYLMYEKNRKHK